MRLRNYISSGKSFPTHTNGCVYDSATIQDLQWRRSGLAGGLEEEAGRSASGGMLMGIESALRGFRTNNFGQSQS